MTNRNSPPRAAGAQGSFDCRREAPGGLRMGPQLQAELRPKAIPDQGPVRGPLDPDCRPEVGVPLPASRRSEQPLTARGAARRCADRRSAFPCQRPVKASDEALHEKENKWQRTLFAARVFGGKCERGDSPLSQKSNDPSELAAARRRRAREFRWPARSAGRVPDGAPSLSEQTTPSYSLSWPRPGPARRGG